MSSSSIPDYYHVHIGTWTNFSHGRIFGATLTLNQKDGALLIAFIALFVTVVGTSFWRLACYALHYIFSTETPRDGLHHQVQATFRNSANGISGVTNFIWILKSWKTDAKQPYRRILPLIAFGVCTIVAFGLASGFSSSISSAMGDEVLVRSNQCGILAWNDTTTAEEMFTLIEPFYTERFLTYSSYASQCYSSHSDTCRFYIKDRLPMQSITNATCPFGGGICRSPNNTLILDSGLLDIHKDLGVNLPADQRFLYRNMVRCAPLKVEPYQHFHNYTDDDGITTAARYFYGERLDGTNNTYTYEYQSNQKRLNNLNYVNADYTLGTNLALLRNGTYLGTGSGFYPIPELALLNADISIFFLSANQILFASEVNDDWYSAHQPYNGTLHNTLLSNSEPYVPREQDTPVSTLACAQQHQWCTSHSCTPFTSFLDKDAAMRPLLRTKDQIDRWNWILGAMMQASPDIAALASSQPAQSLTSRKRLFGGLQGPLPDNQWQLDVEHWYASVLAALQEVFVDIATGPADMALAPLLLRPENEQQRRLCASQKIRSTAYTNISIFGLSLILSLGTIVILLATFLESLVALVLRWRKLDTYAHLEWGANETLTIQRLAHEELGLGRWKECGKAVPVTEKGDLLAVLDLGEKGHVRLKAPVRGWEDEVKEEELRDEEEESREGETR